MTRTLLALLLAAVAPLATGGALDGEYRGRLDGERKLDLSEREIATTVRSAYRATKPTPEASSPADARRGADRRVGGAAHDQYP